MTKTRQEFKGIAVGRIVQGDPWVPNTTDTDGQPRVIKNGPNAGQPNPQYVICVAYPKMDPQNPSQPNPHFAQFLQDLDSISRTSWPQFYPNGGPCVNPNFSNKVRDGDGIDANGRSNATKEGFAGCWVVTYSNSSAPKIYQKQGGAMVLTTDPRTLKRGDYVRVQGDICSNESTQRPGMYVNLKQIEIIAPGAEITSGMDPNDAFSAPAVLPPGVSSSPYAAPVTQAPVAAPAPPVAPAPIASFVPAPVMTAAANGLSRDSYIASGWTDEQLIANGLMIA